MNFNYKLTDNVLNFIKSSLLEEVNIGCSDSQVFKIKKEDNTFFLKIAKKGLLTKEYEKLKWLDGKLNVPKIILYDFTFDTEYLITESIHGEMICSSYYLSNPEVGIKIIAEAFNQIYKVDIKNCPFDVSINYKLNLISDNVKNNLVKDKDLKEETLKKYGSVANVLEFLKNNKFDDEICFSHGDTSLPNIFASQDKFIGFIDVGECGLADKWFDLAICEKSIKRNYGEKYIDLFYKELKIIPDRQKIDYYLLMMELYL